MDITKICINCMKEKPSEGSICPYCGFNLDTYFLQQYELTPYTILNGKYLLGRAIGSGGFGITYIAKDMFLERIVAIKEFYMKGTMYRSQTQPMTVTGVSDMQEKVYEINAEKFEKEAVILAQLDSLNGIVKVYDFFKENRTAYIVMEYLNGNTLKEYVKNHGGKLTVEETCEKLMPVMQSLAEIHRNKILHRDISPDNMKFFNDKELKLFDFGGAKLQSIGGLSEMTFKKVGYTPIEMYSSDGKQGPWTDIYAMCATIYYCITGIVPEESVKRIDVDQLKKPSELGIVISKKIEHAIMKGMSLKGQDRYQSMEELIADLQETKHPKKLKFAAIGIAIVVLGIVSFFIFHYSGEKNNAKQSESKSADKLYDVKEIIGRETTEQETIEQETTEQETIEQETTEQETTERETTEQETTEQETIEQEMTEPDVTRVICNDIAEGTYYIVPYTDTQSCIHVKDNSNQDNASMILRNISHDNYQMFQFTLRKDYKGYLIDPGYVIECEYNGRVLSVKDQYSGTGAALSQRVFQEDPDQYWMIENAGDGAYYIRSIYGTYFDIGTVEENGIRLNDFTGSENQKWKLEQIS